MFKPLDKQIRLKVQEYLQGDISLEEFDDWFVPKTWDVHLSDNREAEYLTEEIEHLFNEFTSEHTSDYRDESVLRKGLEALFAPAVTLGTQSAATSSFVGKLNWFSFGATAAATFALATPAASPLPLSQPVVQETSVQQTGPQLPSAAHSQKFEFDRRRDEES